LAVNLEKLLEVKINDFIEIKLFSFLIQKKSNLDAVAKFVFLENNIPSQFREITTNTSEGNESRLKKKKR